MSNSEVGVAKLYPYRFVILALVSGMNAFLQFSILIVPGVSVALMGMYGIPAAAFTIIATMPYLTGFVFGVLAGAWADKTSIRLVLIVGTAVAFSGALIRAFSTSFILLAIAAFLLGFGLASLNATSAKVMRLWFPSRSTSIAMGIYVAAATAGAAVGIGIGPVIASVELAFQISAGLMAVALIAWIALGRKHPDGEKAATKATESFAQHLKVVTKSKNAWLFSLSFFALYGCTVSIQTFAILGYTNLSGSAANAGILSAFNTAVMGVGGILMPILISRMKRLKPIFIASGILNAAVLISILHVGFGPITFVIIAFEGLLYGVLIPMGKTLPALVPDIKLSHIGAAGGMQSMFQNLGAFLVPSFIITPICIALAGGDTALLPILVFSGAGISSIICSLFIIFIPETGTSVAARLEREAAQAAAQEKASVAQATVSASTEA
jgi:cyanate permease